ncbi:MAG: hypothetical protein Q8P78_03165 [bacterium]|nr:hypothetical protein [bacterium]
MHGFAKYAFALALVAVFGCDGRGPGRVMGPESEPAYRPAGAAQANAVIRPSDFTNAPISGRVRFEAFMAQPQGLVRVSTETADADAEFMVYVSRIPGDGDNDGVVGFDDFFLLADSFGSREGASNFNSAYDLDANDVVDLHDFFVFADYFGMSVPSGAGKRLSLVPPVSYEASPRGRMSEEVFKQCWEALLDALYKPVPAGKALQLAEPQYLFRFTSLEDPPRFDTFEFGVTGAFPAPGEPMREVANTATIPVAEGAARVNPEHVPFVDRYIPVTLRYDLWGNVPEDMAQVVVNVDASHYYSFTIELDQYADAATHRWGYGIINVPQNDLPRIRNWEAVIIGPTKFGATDTTVVAFTQAARPLHPGEEPEPDPEPEPEPDPEPEDDASPQPNILEIVGPLSLGIGDVPTYHAITQNATRIEWYVTRNGVRDSEPRFTGMTLEFPIELPGTYVFEAVVTNDSGSDEKSAIQKVGPIQVLAGN